MNEQPDTQISPHDDASRSLQGQPERSSRLTTLLSYYEDVSNTALPTTPPPPYTMRNDNLPSYQQATTTRGAVASRSHSDFSPAGTDAGPSIPLQDLPPLYTNSNTASNAQQGQTLLPPPATAPTLRQTRTLRNSRGSSRGTSCRRRIAKIGCWLIAYVLAATVVAVVIHVVLRYWGYKKSASSA